MFFICVQIFSKNFLKFIEKARVEPSIQNFNKGRNIFVAPKCKHLKITVDVYWELIDVKMLTNISQRFPTLLLLFTSFFP